MCFGFIFACGRVVREEAEETPTLTVAPFDETKISTETVSIEGETVSREVVSDQIIVTLATGESLSNLEALAAQHGCSVVGQNSLLNTYQIQIPSNKTPAEMRSVFSSSNVVADASSNLIIYTSALPNDPAFEHASDYWGFSKISAEAVWDLKDDIDDSNMIVAVIDTGIDSDHEEFAARIQEGENYVVGGTSTEDDLGHGTSVAGIIGAKGNNAKGIAGMSWNCKLVAIRAFKKKQVSAGSYAGVSTTYAIINALGYAAYVAKAKVINCSFGVETTDSTVINKFKEAVRSCKDKDVLIVTAAGNENKSASNQYPGALSDDAQVGGAIINVGGTGGNNAYNDARWNSSDGASNYGDKVDVAAPACRLYSTYISSEANPDYYKRLQWGTSLAAPFVAGTAALIRSLNPSLTAAGVKSIITETADSISADQLIGGRLNAWKAILMAMSEGNISKAVIGIASNVSGAKIYFSSNGGASFTDTGKTTTAEGTARIMVAAGSGLNYYFKLTKSGYQNAISGLITSIAAGVEVTETINMTPGYFSGSIE